MKVIYKIMYILIKPETLDTYANNKQLNSDANFTKQKFPVGCLGVT